ncbi:hypothetical protein XPA_008061 [Xanthoria parietina]
MPWITTAPTSAVKSDVESVLNKVRPQVIIHTASPIAMASNNSALYYAVNVDGTRNLLECARDLKTVNAFVYTSSASVAPRHRQQPRER